MSLFFIFLIVWFLIWIVFLTNDKTEVVVRVFWIIFIAIIVWLLSLLVIWFKNTEVDKTYDEYYDSINNLQESILRIENEINKCRDVRWVKDFTTLICKDGKVYIKERYFRDIVIYLKVYFRDYALIHRTDDIRYLIKYIKEKDGKIENDFLKPPIVTGSALSGNTIKWGTNEKWEE